MDRKSHEGEPCSIARSLDVLGDWWAPLIVRECLYGVHGFSELQRWLGISRNILSRRLQRLVEHGVLEKRVYREKPRREGYYLTEKGFDMARVLMAVMPFGERWFFEPGAPPISLYDRRTDRPVRVEIVDAETGEPIDARHLYPGPGPCFPACEDTRSERFAEFYGRRAKKS